jgi:integrase
MPLNSNQIKSQQPGTHADGGGLYLVVRDSGERVWAFRFTDLDGKRAQMEFAKAVERATGKPGEKSLAEARDEASHYRVELRRNGVDPRIRKRAVQSGGRTFKEFAEEHYPSWCKGLHKDEPKNWERSIRDVPSLHNVKLHAITTDDVFKALKPLWDEKPVTASRIRQRIERVLDAAKALKLRSGENAAAWRGNLKVLLPSVRKVRKKKPHASISYGKAPALMTALSYDAGNSARCVEVGVLTVTRSQEIRLMEWTEIDFDRKQWLIPAEKMKIRGEEEPKPHLVPLSDQAIEIIQSMPRVGCYVFPSDAKQTADHAAFLANALVGTIKRAGFEATMHGMRTTFRNWGGESVEHNFRREVLEHCLSHRVGDESELSYWTGDMIERRRIVLQSWADYVKPRKLKAAKKKPSLKLVA